MAYNLRRGIVAAAVTCGLAMHLPDIEMVAATTVASITIIFPQTQRLWQKGLYWTKFKGTVQRDFRHPFFSLFESVRVTGQWAKIFSILVKISRIYLNWVALEWHLGEIDYLGYDTPRGVMFWRILYWLAGEWYSREIDSPRNDTPGRLTRYGIIPQGDGKI